MTEAVLDAAVVIKWFRSQGERHADEARALRRSHEAGALVVLTPPLLGPEIVNVAGRRWHWEERPLVELAAALDELGFQSTVPDLVRVAHCEVAQPLAEIHGGPTLTPGRLRG